MAINTTKVLRNGARTTDKKEFIMITQKRFLIISLIAIVLMATSGLIYFFNYQVNNTQYSLLLYTSYPSKETTINWIVNMDTGEKWEVGSNMEAGRWSPSGKHITFYTYIRKVSITSIWVSDSDGRNLRQVFDSRNYPDLKIKGYDWLTDEMIIVNVVSKAENSGFVYLLNINSLSFERHNAGNFMKVSPNGNFWIQWAGQYELSDLDGKTIPLPDYLSDYYFSPAKDKIAYSCSGKYKFSSLCVADVSMSGITNEQKIAENAFLNAYGEAWWSLDGKYIGVMYSTEETKETKFKAIDVSNGLIVYDLAFPTKTTRNFWSPRGDKIIDFDGLLLDLKTGQISNFFSGVNETVPSYVVDWRSIEVP